MASGQTEEEAKKDKNQDGTSEREDDLSSTSFLNTANIKGSEKNAKERTQGK